MSERNREIVHAAVNLHGLFGVAQMPEGQHQKATVSHTGILTGVAAQNRVSARSS
jgi:hypothetical protein